jgi:hypothetical protein
MTDAVIRQRLQAKRVVPAQEEGKRNLYPLQNRFLVVGLVSGLIVTVLMDWVSGLSIFALFALVGCSWRADIPPIFPACLAYQWVAASVGYIWRQVGGSTVDTIEIGTLAPTLIYSLAGLAALALGLRLVLWIFGRQILAVTMRPPQRYRLVRVFWVVIVSFAINYLFYLTPWYVGSGWSQTIQNLLLLRFVPYFLLVVTVFERGKGHVLLLVATAWVIGPEFLTGFASFKEILLVLVIGAMSQWRPWIKSTAQSRRNRQVITYGLIGLLAMAGTGLVWTGGMKTAWRDQVWTQGPAEVSPLERMGDFITTFGQTTSNLEIGSAAEVFMSRVSSSEFYFARVGQRVPGIERHENGKLLMMALQNAFTPRFLFADKALVASDSWLVRKYAGVNVAGEESGTSVALGYMAEFFIDFGVLGVIVLSFLWGGLGGLAVTAMAKCTSSRELLLALVIGLFVQSFMGFETSFIKLLGGMLMRTFMACVLFLLLERPFTIWISDRSVAGPHQQGSRTGTVPANRLRPARTFPPIR